MHPKWAAYTRNEGWVYLLFTVLQLSIYLADYLTPPSISFGATSLAVVIGWSVRTELVVFSIGLAAGGRFLLIITGSENWLTANSYLLNFIVIAILVDRAAWAARKIGD